MRQTTISGCGYRGAHLAACLTGAERLALAVSAANSPSFQHGYWRQAKLPRPVNVNLLDLRRMAKKTFYQWQGEDEGEESSDDRPPSRSEKKRQASRVTKLGVRLIELQPKVLARLELHEELREAIELCRTMRRGNAQAQQIRLVGKLLRKYGTDELIAELERLTTDVHEKAAIARVRADQSVGRGTNKPR